MPKRNVSRNNPLEARAERALRQWSRRHEIEPVVAEASDASQRRRALRLAASQGDEQAAKRLDKARASDAEAERNRGGRDRRKRHLPSAFVEVRTVSRGGWTRPATAEDPPHEVHRGIILREHEPLFVRVTADLARDMSVIRNLADVVHVPDVARTKGDRVVWTLPPDPRAHVPMELVGAVDAFKRALAPAWTNALLDLVIDAQRTLLERARRPRRAPDPAVPDFMYAVTPGAIAKALASRMEPFGHLTCPPEHLVEPHQRGRPAEAPNFFFCRTCDLLFSTELNAPQCIGPAIRYLLDHLTVSRGGGRTSHSGSGRRVSVDTARRAITDAAAWAKLTGR